MLRAFARLAVVTVTALTLIVVAVPAADARPLAAGPAPSVEQSWFAAAWSWLSTLVPVLPQATGGVVRKDLTATPIVIDPNDTRGLGGPHPMTGACIDPNGVWIPCILIH